MGLREWIRSHPITASLLALVVVVAFTAGATILYIVSDQRRSARLLSYTLREALGLEIRIERLIQAGPDRLVFKGVSFPATPLDLRIPEVRIEGRLLALVTHRAGRLTLTAIGPTITLPPSAAAPPVLVPLGVPPETLAAIRQAVRQLLGEPIALSLRATDGVLRRGQESASFALQFAKELGESKASLALQIRGGTSGIVPLSIVSSVALENDTLLLRISGEGNPALLLPPGLGPVETRTDTRFSAETTLRLSRTSAVEIAGQLSAGPVSLGRPPLTRSLRLGIEATYQPEGERLEIRRLAVDAGDDTHLIVQGAVSGSRRPEITATLRQGRINGSLVRALLPWSPTVTGILEIPELSLSARMGERDSIPFSRLRGQLRIPALTAAPTYPVSGARVDVTLSLEREPTGSTMIARGVLRADSLAAGPLAMEGVSVPYVLKVDQRGTLLSGETRGLSGRLWAAPVTATAIFAGESRKLSVRLEGRGVDLSRWAQSAGLKDLWDPRSPMRIGSLTGVLEASLDPSARAFVRDATVRLEGGPVEGHLQAAGLPFGVERLSVKVAIDAASPGGEPLRKVTWSFSLAGLRGLTGARGELPQLSGQVRLRAALENGLGAIEVVDGLLEVLDEVRRPLLRVTARPWLPPAPAFRAVALAVELPDLTLLGPHLSDLSLRLDGSANGTLRLWQASAEEPLRYDGQFSFRVVRGEFVQGSLRVENLRVEIPVKGEAESTTSGAWGELTADSVKLYGVELRSLRSPIRMAAGMLSVSDLRYDVYGGKGSGWIEATPSRDTVSVRARLEGERIDLDRLVREYPIQGGNITGRLHYLVGFRYSSSQGPEVGGTLAVKEPGGTVSISFLRRLLSYAEADPTGILRQTLQNLSEFPYQTLDVDVRTLGGVTQLNLKLVGRGSLFGLLPPKVREINIRNLPLDFVVRTFSGQ